MNKTQLKARCEELGIDTKDLNTNAKLEAAIEAKEAELAKAEEQKPETSEQKPETSEQKPETSEEEKSTDHYEDERGRKWKFKDSAPKTLNIDGHPTPLAEILATEEYISELVYGNSSYLTQIHE